ncbi:MAG: L-fucose/L-arabinose isomerase family protein [Cyclobacteriaceae bacterium]|nr:L-fucose/L-arabinose isomerase family protein [Cyclobacteriaceae bacterium]
MNIPKIGFLGIMQELYDKTLPDITKIQENYAREVIKQFDEIIRFDFPRAARNRKDIEDLIGKFNQDDLDGIMIVMLTYGPGMRTVRGWQMNRLPLLLANIQPRPHVSADWNMDELTYNQGIHGAQDTANAIIRTVGNQFAVISEDWKSGDFKAYVTDWARAAQAATALRKMKVAVFGKMFGMGDTLSDEAAFTRVIGPEVNREYIGQVYRNMEEINKTEITGQVEKDRKNFRIDENMPPEAHEYAVRMQLGFKKLLRDGNYSAFSAHFDVFKGDGRFRQLPMLAASNLMAEGYGYAAEGDSNTASMVAAGHYLAPNAHFTEMYAMDFKRDSMLMSHMGEGNCKIARKDRPVRLANRFLGIGDLDNPPTPVFSAEPGPATMVSLVHLEGDQFRLVSTIGEILDTEEFPNIEMPYFHFKPSTGVRQCNDNWLLAGGTHHQTLHLGDQRQKWSMLADILGIEFVQV